MNPLLSDMEKRATTIEVSSATIFKPVFGFAEKLYQNNINELDCEEFAHQQD